MKATVIPHLYTRRSKENGKYPVKLRVRYSREKKFFALGIEADSIIDNLKDEFSWEKFENEFLAKKESVKVSTSDVFLALHNYKEELFNEERVKTSICYQCSSNALTDFVKSSKLSFLDITPQFLKEYEKHMRAKGLSTSTVSIYMRNLRTIYNQALENKMVPQEAYPFGKNKYIIPASTATKKALKVNDIGKIYSYEAKAGKEEWARDMWMFSYFGNGLNIKDVAYLKYKNFVGGEINIIRQKTKNSKRETEKKIVIIVTDEMREIIKKWGNKNKNLNEYVFDILRKEGSALDHVRDVEQAIKSINLYVTRIAEKLKLDKRPTTNFARHSFATVLKRAGVSTEMISEQLGHSSIKTTQIYLDSFEKDQRKDAIKHLTAFKNVTKKKLNKIA